MSQVDDWSDGYTSDYLRDLNTYGPASANAPRSSVVSHQVRYRAPDTSDIPLAPGQNPEDSVYSNASGARMGQLKPRSGYNPPAGGGYTAQTFPHESGGRRYARSKKQSRSRGSAPANGVKTRSAPLSGSDVTADVLRSVKADGNTSFANWRQSLVNQGWSQAEADAVRYDPSTGKFMSNASGQAATDHYMREQADKDAGIMADNPEVEGKVSGQTPAKTEESTQPAPAKTEESTQPAPAKTDTQTPAPADDHEQEAKAAVDEFLKQHPEDGKERLKSIYAAVDSQNIKDDAAYNLAVIAEIQKAQTPAKTDTQTSAPVPGRSFVTTENTGDNHVPNFGVQPAPADDHEQEAKAAVDEFLKQHPEDGKERLKSIYAAVDSQNIKDDAAYNLAVIAEIQKAQTPAASGDNTAVDNLLNNPGNTEAVDLGKAVSSERQAQTESGVNDYQDQLREGINWLRMFHAPDDPAGVRAEAAITAIGNMLRSSDPERYKRAVEELEKQKSYVINANNEEMANDITEGSKVFGDPEKLGLRAAAARQGLRADRQHRLNENYYTDVFGSKLFHDAMDGNIVTPDSIRAAEYVRQLRAANAAKAQAAAEAAEQRADNPEGWL